MSFDHVHTNFIGGDDSAWVKHRIKDRYDYYYNLETKEGTWTKPKEFEHNTSQLTKEEIQVPVHQPASMPSCRRIAPLKCSYIAPTDSNRL